LDEAVRQGKIQNGDIVVLTAFGAGLTSGSIVIKWVK
ncbi:MAG: 3-oxoacyl-ACP synthase, partial [Candidatus Atribacteria bacterium]|nr:3-oxoacyl-ACP synthase [Candidatus Atribacteria bacterium]